MMSVDEARDELKNLLGHCERWLSDLEEVSDILPEAADRAEDIGRVQDLRTRALSVMLRVALVGRQSSGKSFLISSLQGGLRYEPFIDEDGEEAEEYVGILPSSASPTTACPATVTPVDEDSPDDASGRGLLKVKFKGTGWTEIGTDLDPDVVAAYAAVHGDAARRRPEHAAAEVEEIELLISQAPLPVRLFDLPGSESAEDDLEFIMRSSWDKADCFIYTSQATEGLSATELSLIKDLYTHAGLGHEKPVLWVLTGIDRANHIEHNQKAWKDVLVKNNQYLRDHYPSSYRNGDEFFGEGFLPVSSAWEAKADHADAYGGDGSIRRRNSGMPVLRDRLRDLVASNAGRKNLRKVAETARLLMKHRKLSLADTLNAHRVAVGQLEGERDALRQRLEGMQDSRERMRADLERELDRRIRAAQQPFGDLAAVLHRELDGKIDAGNLSAEHVHEIDVRQVQVFTEWMTAPGGPATLLERELGALDISARNRLEAELGKETGSQLVSFEPLDTSYFLAQSDERRPLTLYGLVQAAANTVGVASPIAGLAVWLTTSLSLATIAIPIGAAVAAAIGLAKATEAMKERESQIQRARQERKDQIDEAAKQARTGFEEMARERGRRLIDAAEENHREHENRLQASLIRILGRMSADDTARSRAIVGRLEPVERAGRAVIDDLQDLVDLHLPE
ncbi:GTPase domain-containing protein [Streptomyces sp. NPDC006356]